MKATKIKMKYGCGGSKKLVEIDSIYLTGCSQERFYKKEVVHDEVKAHPGSIQVNIFPYPDIVPAISPAPNYEKYVRSEPNDTTSDNLLSLPRE